MTARRPLLAVVAALLAWATLPRVAAAQTKADAFAGKIPPVSGQLFRKAGRLELGLGGDVSINDAFFTKYFGGLELAYHLTESFALSLHGAGGFTTATGSAVVCSAKTGCSDASEVQMRQVPGRIRGLAALGVAWSPVYGKLNVLAEKVAHFDLAVLGGVDFVAHDEVLSRAHALVLEAEGADPKLTTTYGFHVGLGARLFLYESMAVRLVVKDLVYAVKVPNNGSENDWQHQLFTEVGLSFFFPMHNRPLR